MGRIPFTAWTLRCTPCLIYFLGLRGLGQFEGFTMSVRLHMTSMCPYRRCCFPEALWKNIWIPRTVIHSVFEHMLLSSFKSFIASCFLFGVPFLAVHKLPSSLWRFTMVIRRSNKVSYYVVWTTRTNYSLWSRFSDTVPWRTNDLDDWNMIIVLSRSEYWWWPILKWRSLMDPGI